MVIITIAGDPGSGKSTLARQLAARLGVPHFSMGDLYREFAQRQGLDVLEYAKRAEADPDFWDRKADAYQAELPKKHPSFVIDSRLGFHFLPQSIKIYLKVDRNEAAMRVMGDQREEERWHSAEEGVRALETRQRSELARYTRLYGLDHTDPKHFDLVLDTTHLNAEEKFEKAMEFLAQKGVGSAPGKPL
jgi:cytidylate kinase